MEKAACDVVQLQVPTELNSDGFNFKKEEKENKKKKSKKKMHKGSCWGTLENVVSC